MIKLYTQSGCGMCRAVHMKLDQKKIPYEEVIITVDNVDFYKERGILATPTLEVDGILYSKKECLDWINTRA